MKQYRDLVNHVLTNGVLQPNRTGTPTLKCNGYMMQFDMTEGFPLLGLKKTPFKMAIGEMLAFLRGYSNVEDFQKLGVSIWDANAEASYWLDNPACKGDGDLGRIYGVQARDWRYVNYNDWQIEDLKIIDQLKNVVNDLSQGIDNRREIVTHWNPGELEQMALPPCHLLYQFGITGDKLNLSMYQRSADVGLGVPFNIAGYSWLLEVIAHITGFKPGTFTHFLHDVHIYENHIEGLKKMLEREDRPLPEMWVDTNIESLHDLETWVIPSCFGLEGYNPHPAIKLSMAL